MGKLATAHQYEYTCTVGAKIKFTFRFHSTIVLWYKMSHSVFTDCSVAETQQIIFDTAYLARKQAIDTE